jgi:hypothetical protein
VVVPVLPLFVSLVLFVPLLFAYFVFFVPQLCTPPFLTLALVITNVSGVVFNRLHEIDLPVARVVFVAMQSPGPGMIRRNVEVERLRNDHIWRGLLDKNGSRIDQRRWRPATEVHSHTHPERSHRESPH